MAWPHQLRRSALSLALALVGLCVSVAQVVSPPVKEYPDADSHSATEGRLELSNSTLEPLVVTLEAKSFTIDAKGNAKFSKLSPGIHLQLSATSMRIPPKQTRVVFYKASAAAYPAWFCIYSSFSGMPRKNGISVELDLPHTVYLMQKAKIRGQDIALSDMKTEGGELRGVVHNNGPSVVRVLSMDVTGAHAKKTTGGFPILPGATRDFAVPLDPTLHPTHIRATFATFHVDEDIH